jgi:ABC-type antimicrobial peptide transport system permease subunit
MVVNQTFARRFWPGSDPLGKQVRTAGRNHEVVGVARDGKYFSLGEEPKAYMYLPLAQNYRGSTVLHVRGRGDAEALLGSVRSAIRSLDPLLPVSDLKTMHAALGFALLPARMAAGVVSAFAAIALLLAAVGLYGVIAYSVAQGTREIGIRMALGARPADVRRLVLSGGMKLAAVGLAVGLAGGLALGRVMQGILYGVSATDPFSFASAAVVLLGAAILASFLPARRATRVDPMLALRVE